jgi:hypothetical protein
LIVLFLNLLLNDRLHAGEALAYLLVVFVSLSLSLSLSLFFVEKTNPIEKRFITSITYVSLVLFGTRANSAGSRTDLTSDYGELGTTKNGV